MLLSNKIQGETFLKIDNGTDDILDKLIDCFKILIVKKSEINAETVFLQSKDQKVLTEFMRIDLEILKEEGLSKSI